MILVDDGIATGASMRAAVLAVRAMGPARVVVAAPVALLGAVAELRNVADEVVCVATPSGVNAVGSCYAHFPQTGDDEVRMLLATAGAVAMCATDG